MYSLRSGSVIAEVQVVAANPNITEVKLSFSNLTNVSEYSVDGRGITIQAEPGA